MSVIAAGPKTPERDAAYFVSIIEASPDCVRILDLKGRVEFANGACMTQFGAAGDHERTWTELWPRDAPVGSTAALREAARGEILSFRTICPLVDGQSRCWETVISPILGLDGAKTRRLFTRSTDVTDEIERLHFLGAIVEATPAALFVKDGASGRYLLVNRAAEAMLGYSRDAMIGKDDYKLFPKAQADAFQGADRDVLEAGGVTLIEEEEVTSAAGQHRWSRTRKSAVDGLGGAKYLIAVAEDITEAKEAKAALQQALADAEAANRAKSDFLTNMSHEIRTPLNGVLGMVQVMLADELTSSQQEHLRVIRQSGETLLSVLNDLLDVARIDSRTIETELSEFDLEQAIHNAAAPFLPLAQTKGLKVIVDIDDSAKGIFHGDSARFRRVIQNLLSNAVKFTDKGRVVIAAHGDDAGIGLVVSDTGIGIAPEQLPLVFEAFVQVDSSITRRHGGAGLGLSICRGLINEMGGTIEVESTPRSGSRFTLTLPFLRSQALDVPVAETTPLEAEFTPRVLVAEDNPINQHVLKTLLAQTGIDPVIVDNGRLAVDAWESGDWDLILMDIQMPEMDGVSATRAIREREIVTGRAYTPIVAVTANVMAHQVETYYVAGMSDVLSKPLDAARLFVVLEKALFGADQRPLDPAASDGASMKAQPL